jgi:two-component system phosphate regulon response regulator PhoB
MIVEDEATLLEMLRYNFEKAEYAVETISHGGQAEIRLQEIVPDLLVLDWMLPGLSGIEPCRRLRRSGARTLPIIMLTARREEADRMRGCLETGAATAWSSRSR